MTAEEILSRYETYVKLSQPHNTTPIFLKENVLLAMKEYAKQEVKKATEKKDLEILNLESKIRDLKHPF